MLKAVVVLLVILASVGAASAKPVPHEAAPSPSMGYVAGAFTTLQLTHAAAFVLTNQETGKDYILPSVTRADYPAGNKETVLIALPPGSYRFTRWMIYNSWTGPNALGREIERAIEPGARSQPFMVGAGDVVLLGAFVVHTALSSFAEYGGWTPQQLSLDDAKALLAASYPNFSATPLTCIECSSQSPPP